MIRTAILIRISRNPHGAAIRAEDEFIQTIHIAIGIIVEKSQELTPLGFPVHHREPPS
jgi:hypothetical protein